jgi:hypothetical protein
MRLSNSISGALRAFSYFMASGSHYMLQGVNYSSLYGNEPSATEQTFAIFANVLECEEHGAYTLRVPVASYFERSAPQVHD